LCYLRSIKNLILLAGFVALQSLRAAPPPASADSSESIVVTGKQISCFCPAEPSRNLFGSLAFRGGLVLSSENSHFGGFSALWLQPDGSHFLALSDRAFWLQGRLSYSANRPSAINDAHIAPVLNSKGKPASYLDTESLAENGPVVYVGIEGLNSIQRFDFAQMGIHAPAQPFTSPPGIKSLPGNKGLEALVFVPKPFRLAGTLLAFSERGLDQAGNLRSFLIGGPTPGAFTIRRSHDFDISDAALLPNGDVLILERKFFLFSGITIRIRHIRASDIKPGAIVDGPILFEADSSCELDNMEALSINRSTHGETILTLLSDDNFSILQRTLLLQFALNEK
jgi:hypothetical protein